MALKFDLGEALSQAAHAAGEMAKGASATVESAAKGVANAAEGAGNAIVDTAAGETDVARLPAQLAAAHFEHDLFLPVFVNNRY